MALQPKTEPRSPPIFPSSGHKNLKQMSISELVQVLRVAWQIEDFDRVEEVLVAREANLRAEIGPLQEKVELERLIRLKAEEELKKREERCEKGKRAQESYETLLKEVKKSGLHDKNTIGNLRNKNKELECENLKLMELKKKWEGDGYAVDELRKRVAELENEKLELEDEKKKNLATIDELNDENCKLVDKKLKADAKFVELLDRVERLEKNAKLLMSEYDSVGGENNKGEPQADPGVPFNVKEEEGTKEFNDEMDVGGSAPLQRSKDARQSLGASGNGNSARLAYDYMDMNFLNGTLKYVDMHFLHFFGLITLVRFFFF